MKLIKHKAFAFIKISGLFIPQNLEVNKNQINYLKTYFKN